MKRWLPLSLVLVLGIGIGQFGWQMSQAQVPALPPVPVAPAIPRELTSYRDLVKKVLPAVVSIDAKAKVSSATKKGRRPDDPRFDEEESPKGGFGSGFLVDPSGVILTNFHVVEGADTVVVTLNDGRKFTSKNIRVDQRTDLAIVLLDAKEKDFPYLELGDSEAYEIGDRVLAIGAPFGLTGSVTHGIISAKGRHNLNMNLYEDFIQTDAAINPGNSGGPLVGLDGKVVGINAAIKSRSGGFQGVGLAVASSLAKNVVKSLRTDGVVRRGYLGVSISSLNFEVATRLGLPRDRGVVIASVFENTPASKAGLRAGDILTAIEGQPVRDSKSMQLVVAGLPINKAAKFDLIREGKATNLMVTIEEQPKDFGTASLPPAAPRLPQPAEGSATALDKTGLEIADLTDEIAEDLGLRKGLRGVVIIRIQPGSIAAQAGMRRGMMIMRIEKTTVDNVPSAVDALKQASLQRGVLFQVASSQTGISFIVLKQN